MRLKRKKIYMNYIEEFFKSKDIDVSKMNKSELAEFLFHEPQLRKELIELSLKKVEEHEKEGIVDIFSAMDSIRWRYYTPELIVKNAKSLYEQHEPNDFRWFEYDNEEFMLLVAVFDSLHSKAKNDSIKIKVSDAIKIIALEMTLSPSDKNETLLEPLFGNEEDWNVAVCMPYRMYRMGLKGNNSFSVKNRIFIATSALVLLVNFYEGFFFACSNHRDETKKVELTLLETNEPSFDTRFYSEALVIKFASNPFFKNNEFVYELSLNFLGSFKDAFEYKESKVSKWIDVLRNKVSCRTITNSTNNDREYTHFLKVLSENCRRTRIEKAKSELFLKLLDSELITNIILKK